MDERIVMCHKCGGDTVSSVYHRCGATTGAASATVELARLTILIGMDELRRAKTLATIERRDNA